jgi:hypothetical protein
MPEADANTQMDDVESCARRWLALREEISLIGKQRTELNKQRKETEKLLHAHLINGTADSVTIDGTTISLKTTVVAE